MHILPYCTVDNVIEGLVLTFKDITKLKMSEKRSTQILDLLEGIMNAMPEPRVALDKTLHVTMVNQASCRVFKTNLEENVGQAIFEMGNGAWDVPSLRETLATAQAGQAATEYVAVPCNFPGFDHRVFEVNVRLIAAECKESLNILLTFSKGSSA